MESGGAGGLRLGDGARGPRGPIGLEMTGLSIVCLAYGQEAWQAKRELVAS